MSKGFRAFVLAIYVLREKKHILKSTDAENIEADDANIDYEN